MEFSEVTKKYWEKRDWEDLEKAKSMSDMRVIALRVIERMPKPIVQVCGPIATGGLGSIEKNLDIFNKTIQKLQKKGLNVFDQMPFEAPMQKLKEEVSTKDVVDSIMNDFYLPIFNSGIISAFYFLPEWQGSHGANLEHELAQKIGIKISYL